MQELIFENFELWLALPFTVMSSFIGAMALKPSRGKNVVLVSLALLVVGEALFLVWGITLRTAKAASAPTRRARAKAQPAPVSKPTPKVEEVRNNESEDEAIARGVTFSLSSRPNPAIRGKFCIDGDLNGKFYTYAGTWRVKLDTADFDLCKYSSESHRDVEYSIGVGRHNDIASMNWRAITWSKAQRGSVTAGTGKVSHLAPADPLSIPLHRTLRRKPPADLSEYGTVVRVYNRARRGQYYLSENLK